MDDIDPSNGINATTIREICGKVLDNSFRDDGGLTK